jgi:probable F420-dependent oxidoreductase
LSGEPVRIGTYGIRAWQLSDVDASAAADAAAELEELGFATVWIRARGFFERAAALLEATQKLVVASSVISIWQESAPQVSAAADILARRYPGRLLVGIGVSHRPLVDRDAPGRYRHPVQKMCAYLDELDAAEKPLDRDRRIIAALGPRMLAVARDRALGTHPYLVTPVHTRWARAVLGSSRAVAPAHVAVLEEDRDRARAIARRHLFSPYLQLPNYRNTLLRLGFSDADLRGLSDRLVDALVAWGDPGTVADRVREHLRAGASHVAIHLLSEDDGGIPRRGWRRLAEALRAGGVSP